MTKNIFTPLMITAFSWLLLSFDSKSTQQYPPKKQSNQVTNAVKPFRILTAGKRITIQSKTDIKKLMLWTASGHRLVEEKNLNTSTYTYAITIAERIFFLMVELADGKRYTEKFAVKW